jgi:hypothetical protein
MSVEPRLKMMATMFRSLADLIEAGKISDAAFVAIPNEGDVLLGFSAPPARPDELISALNEVVGFAGNTEKNDALRRVYAGAGA